MKMEPYFKEIEGKWYVWDYELEEYVEDNENQDEHRQQATP